MDENFTLSHCSGNPESVLRSECEQWSHCHLLNRTGRWCCKEECGGGGEEGRRWQLARSSSDCAGPVSPAAPSLRHKSICQSVSKRKCPLKESRSVHHVRFSAPFFSRGRVLGQRALGVDAQPRAHLLCRLLAGQCDCPWWSCHR